MSQIYLKSSGGGSGTFITINEIGPDGSGNFTLESTDGSVTFTPIANGLNLSASGGGGSGITTVGDVTSGSVAFNGTIGTTLTSTTAGFNILVTAQGSGNDNPGGAVAITGGDGGSATTGAAGGDVTITGGTGNGTDPNSGGNVNLIGGTPSDTGYGGNINITAPNGGATSGGGGEVVITSGYALGTGNGGSIAVVVGGSLSGQGGAFQVEGGDGTTNGGAILLTAGSSVGSSGNGGAIILQAGESNTLGNGGQIFIESGYSFGEGVGGAVTIVARASSGTDQAAAALTVTGGTGTGAGHVGQLFFEADTKAIASSSTSHTTVNRLILNGSVALTSASAKTIATLTLASGSTSGGVINYLIECNDGTHYQVAAGVCPFSATNISGTKSGNTSPSTESQTISSGTLSNIFSISSGGLLQVTSTTSLTATSYQITYEISCLCSTQTIAIP